MRIFTGENVPIDGGVRDFMVNQFCHKVLDVLNTTKATIGLCDRDIIKNCNTSIYTACKFIETQLSTIPTYEVLRADAVTLVVNIKDRLFNIYGEHFSRWFEFNIAKAEKENPDFYDDLYCIQKLEKNYKYYNEIKWALESCQELLREFQDRLEYCLNPAVGTFKEV